MEQTRLIIEGTIIKAIFGKTRYSEEKKNRLTLKSDSIPYDQIHSYDSVGNKLTPTWFKDKNGYMNLSSGYDIPVKRNNTIMTFTEWIDTGFAIGSDVKMAVNCKDGAIYPTAITVVKDGEPFDPFEGM